MEYFSKILPGIKAIYRPDRRENGFTLVELIAVIAIIAILAYLAMVSYKSYLDRARITVSLRAMSHAQQLLLVYNIDYGAFPDSINLATCVDSLGINVFPGPSCADIKKDIFAFVSYVSSGDTFSLSARANDSAHTLINVTPSTADILR